MVNSKITNYPSEMDKTKIRKPNPIKWAEELVKIQGYSDARRMLLHLNNVNKSDMFYKQALSYFNRNLDNK